MLASRVCCFFMHITYTGRFIKRQRIPLPGCDQDTGPYYKITDIVVGETVTFYGKEMKIIGVDNFTRDFLHRMGMDVPNNESVPDDPYFVYRTEVSCARFGHRRSREGHRLERSPTTNKINNSLAALKYK